MLGVVVGWQLYNLTGSALDLGLVGLVQFVPMVLLTLVVGQVAEDKGSGLEFTHWGGVRGTDVPCPSIWNVGL